MNVIKFKQNSCTCRLNFMRSPLWLLVKDDLMKLSLQVHEFYQNVIAFMNNWNKNFQIKSKPQTKIDVDGVYIFNFDPFLSIELNSIRVESQRNIESLFFLTCNYFRKTKKNLIRNFLILKRTFQLLTIRSTILKSELSQISDQKDKSEIKDEIQLIITFLFFVLQ